MDIPKTLPKYFGLGRVLERVTTGRTRMIYHEVCGLEMVTDAEFIEDYNQAYMGCAGCRFIREPHLSMENPTRKNAVIYNVLLRWKPVFCNWFRWEVHRYL